MISTLKNNIAVATISFSFMALNNPALSKSITLEVILPTIGSNGKSLDGGRVYLLPWETTTETPPEPAVCITTDSGEVSCAPEIGADEAPCPDSYKCVLTVELENPFEAFTVSIFDMDGLPKDILDGTNKVLDDGGSIIRDLTGYQIGSADFADITKDLNIQWTWVESVSFVPLNEDDYYPKGSSVSESLARDVATAIAPWHHFRFASGRIKAPFETQAIDECSAPLPPCVFNYTQITFR